MKTIVIGIGNPILGDDGIGIHVSRNLKNLYCLPLDVTIEEAHTGGLNLLDLIRGYEKVILVDAVSCSNRAHGEVNQYHLDELSTVHSNNPHDVSFPEALHLAKQLDDQQIPTDIIIIGVNLKRMPQEFSESLSPEIQKSIPKAVEMVLLELQKDYKIRKKQKKKTGSKKGNGV